MRTNICVLMLCAASLLLFPVAPVGAEREIEETEEKEFPLAQGGTVKLSATDGSIHISTWDRSQALVKMTKHARGDSKGEANDRLDQIDLVVEQQGDRLIIRERQPEGRSHSVFDLLDPETWDELGGRTTWVDFDLTIPQKANLRLSTDEGDVSVTDIRGDIDLDTDEGNVELKGIRSNRVFIMTDEGDIQLKDIRPEGEFDTSRLEIDADESDVELYEIEMGRVRIESDEGDVVAEKIRCNHLDYRSDEGNMELSPDIHPHEDYRCRTGEGEILLYLPEGSSFRLTASTQEGRIRSDFHLEVRETGDGERVDDAVGTDGADLYLFSEEGGIQIRKK